MQCGTCCIQRAVLAARGGEKYEEEYEEAPAAGMPGCSVPVCNVLLRGMRGRDLDPRTGETVFRYMWMNTDGSAQATTDLRIGREDYPPYADGDHMVVTVENLFPTDDGLWQVVCFWDTDEPEEEDPAYTQQGNMLIRVPEP